MATLINLHNLIIAKSGGLTSTEAIPLNKPMIILGENYGQEKANSTYLTSNGVAIHVKSIKGMLRVIKATQQEDIYNQMADKSKNMFKLSSAEIITKKILSIMNE